MTAQTDRSSYSWNVLATVVVFAVIATTLVLLPYNHYPNLHTILDACVFLLSGTLALLSREMAARIGHPFLRCISISFAVTCLFEFVHVLVLVEWPGPLAAVSQPDFLRPATWPPAAYVLPVGIVSCLMLMKREKVAGWVLGLSLTVFGVAAFGLFFYLPRYTTPGILWITRPTLIAVPFFWAIIAVFCWQRRAADRLLPLLAITALVLLCGHTAMLYSRAPHDTPAMVAHFGKAAGYLALVLSLMAIASDDMRDVLQAERNFRQLLESAPDAMVIVNRDGRIERVNQQAERLFGYSRQDLEQQKVEMLIPERFHMGHPAEREQYAKAPAVRQMGQGRDLYGLRKDGTEFPVDVSLSPLWTNEGLLIISAIRDITERKRTEQRLEEYTKNVEAANKELEEFCYTVSHDLRAPLRHIDGFLGLLESQLRPVMTQESRRYVGTISSAAKRMGNLIDGLLVFARLGRGELHKTRVDLNEVTGDALRELLDEVKDRSIEWKINPLPEVYASRSMLRLVMVNLLANAVKFTRTRSAAEIEVGTSNTGTEVVIFVRDNGVGFDPKYAHQLFGVFRRLHGSEEFEGTGIGLASVRRIIERHGGRTWATGAPDKGATFYFSFPRRGPA